MMTTARNYYRPRDVTRNAKLRSMVARRISLSLFWDQASESKMDTLMLTRIREDTLVEVGSCVHFIGVDSGVHKI